MCLDINQTSYTEAMDAHRVRDLLIADLDRHFDIQFDYEEQSWLMYPLVLQVMQESVMLSDENIYEWKYIQFCIKCCQSERKHLAYPATSVECPYLLLLSLMCLPIPIEWYSAHKPKLPDKWRQWRTLNNATVSCKAVVDTLTDHKL